MLRLAGALHHFLPRTDGSCTGFFWGLLSCGQHEPALFTCWARGGRREIVLACPGQGGQIQTGMEFIWSEMEGERQRETERER